jgi:hypothetical protein
MKYHKKHSTQSIVRTCSCLCFCVLMGLVWLSSPPAAAQNYRVGLYQGVALPQRSLAATTPAINWYPWLNVHFFGKNNPITIGGSLGLQYFPRIEQPLPAESYDVMAFPLSICFQYLLLPNEFRPYYGVETGVAAFRYRFYQGNAITETVTNVALTVTPNAGVKIEIFEGMDLELNVRYQFLFHDIITWGSTGQFATQGYQMLGISLGVNYALWKVYQ